MTGSITYHNCCLKNSEEILSNNSDLHFIMLNNVTMLG